VVNGWATWQEDLGGGGAAVVGQGTQQRVCGREVGGVGEAAGGPAVQVVALGFGDRIIGAVGGRVAGQDCARQDNAALPVDIQAAMPSPMAVARPCGSRAKAWLTVPTLPLVLWLRCWPAAS